MAYHSPTPLDEQRRAAEIAAKVGSYEASKQTGYPAVTIRGWARKLGVALTTKGGAPRREGAPSRARAPKAPKQTRSAAPRDDAQESEEYELASNAWKITLKSRGVQTFDDLVKHCRIDTGEWELEKWQARSYQATLAPRATRDRDRDDEGRPVGWIRPDATPVTVQMYAVTAHLKRKSSVVAARQEIAALVDDAKTQLVRAPLVLVQPPATGYMLELGLPDAHFNKLAWGRETGGANYDLKIAEATYYRAVETLLARAAHVRYERVLYVVGNDALHTDGDTQATTKGTPQDTDTRFFKAFQVVRQVTTSVAERLAKEVAPVHIVVVTDNHAGLSTLMLGDALACWFHSTPHVTVDVEPTARKYFQWGRSMIGFAHGDKGKPELWSRLMPVERPAMWGRTQHREFHVGHMHKESVLADELNGVKVRVLPSLAPPDAWHAAHGFVGNASAAEAFIWHADEGMIGTARYTHAFEDAA